MISISLRNATTRIRRAALGAALLMGLCAGAYAQKAEINAFEKQNKDLLKQLGKDYKAKVAVNISADGNFFLVLSRKVNKEERFMLADEAGALLYPYEITKYKSLKGGYFFICGQDGVGTQKWGVVNIQGKAILPVKFSWISHGEAQQAGFFAHQSSNYWHPATSEYWVATTKETGLPTHIYFFSADGSQVTHEYEGKLEAYRSYFWTVKPEGTKNIYNKKGFMTYDGQLLYPQEYNSYYLETSGMLNCIKRSDNGLSLYGGKMLDQSISTVEVPALFNDVSYRNGTIQVRMHRADDFQDYNPNTQYALTYKDEGERLFDAGQYEKVITFYEGEGYGTAWGDFYMGLAAQKLGDREQVKMDNCITTLKSDKNYYLPIKNPDKYKFEAGTITSMYLSSSMYLEKYLNNKNIPENDPTKVKARKIRGEVVTAKNQVTSKLEEYGTALRAATNKHAQAEAAAAQQRAQQQAQQQATINALSKGLGSLFKGLR